VQSSARPGNARGNALSTNAVQPRARLITQYSSSDDGSTVTVRVPLAPLVGAGGVVQAAALATQHVRASFKPRSFELEVLSDGGVPHLLRVSQLPGELEPEVSASLRTPAPRQAASPSTAAPSRHAATAWRAPARMRPSCSASPRRRPRRPGLR
jgi:hypothetical protein